MNNIYLSIPGNPIAKKRPRFVRRGKSVGTYNDQQTEEGRYLCVASGQISRQIANPLNVPIKITFEFIMSIPESMPKKLKANLPPHTKKPDIDNLIKFSLDCLNGYLFVDDRQITCIIAVKHYGDNPRTEIAVEF